MKTRHFDLTRPNGLNQAGVGSDEPKPLQGLLYSTYLILLLTLFISVIANSIWYN